MVGLIAATERDVYSTSAVVRSSCLIVCLVPGLMACSAQVTTADAEATQLTALVEVDRTVTDVSDPGHSEAIARFVRTRAGDEGALQLVASSELPAIGTCTSSPTGSAQKPVELLDVGAVSLEGTGTRTMLVARRLPDVVDLVSGVVYTARGPEEGSFGAGKYVLRVSGGSELPAFVRDADAPGTPNVQRIADQNPSSVVFVDGAVDVVWEAGSDRDVIVIETSNARCAFADNGHAVLAASSFGAQGTITVRRIHREAFVAPGIDRGEIRFDFARAVPYKHR